MNGELVLDNFEDRLEAFRQSDAERDALVTELIRSYQDIKLKYEEKDDDYKNEVASRRIWQSKASLNERALNEQRQATVCACNITSVTSQHAETSYNRAPTTLS